MTDQEKQIIDDMGHLQMARTARFAPSGSIYMISNTEVSDYFWKKYNELGGMTPAISKQIGW